MFTKYITKKVIINTALGLALVAGGVFLYQSNQAPVKPEPTIITQTSQDNDSTLKTVTNEKISYQDMSEKVLLVNFWATWCPSCRKELPELNKVKEAFKDQPFEIIGVSMDDTKQQVISFMEGRLFKYPVVMANKKLLVDFGPVSVVPTMVIVDKDFKPVKVLKGYRSAAQLSPIISAVLDGNP